MNQGVQDYIASYPNEIQSLFYKIREVILSTAPSKVEEKLWARLPSFYVGERFIRVIPFKDHINIEASGVIAHKSLLDQYKITPKGMLQIYINQDIPYDILGEIFKVTLM